MGKKDNQNKISEKAFTNLLLTSMLSILVCLCALCSASYAWFSTSLTSGGNTIQSAFFDLQASVTDVENDFELTPVDGSYAFEAGRSYTVFLQKTAEATTSQGHCAVVVGEDTYCTEVFSEDFTFTIEASVEKTVSLDARIGYSAELDLIEEGETLTLPT